MLLCPTYGASFMISYTLAAAVAEYRVRVPSAFSLRSKLKLCWKWRRRGAILDCGDALFSKAGFSFGYLGRRAATILEGLSIRHVFSFSDIRRLSVRILVSFRSLHCPTLALSLGVRTPLAVRFIRLSPLGIAVSEIFTLLDFNVAGFPICNSLCIAVSRDSRRDRSCAMSLSCLFAQLHCEALTF